MYLFTQTAYALLTLTALTLATPAPKVDSNTETQLDTPTAVRILDTHCVTYWQGKIGSVCGGQVKEGQNGCSLDDTWIVRPELFPNLGLCGYG